MGSLYSKVMSQAILRSEGEFPMETVKRWMAQKKKITFVEYAEGRWIVSGTRFQYDNSEYTEDQKIFVTDYFPNEEIVNSWSMNLRIDLLAYCNKKWILCTEPNKQDSPLQSFKTTGSSVEELKAEIKIAWDTNKKIDILLYGDKQWILVLSQETGPSGQSFCLNSDWPMEKIKSYYAEQRYITSLVWNDDEKYWVVIAGDVKDKLCQLPMIFQPLN